MTTPDPREAVVARAIHEAECEAYTHEGRNAKCERAARAAVAALDAAAQDTADPADGLTDDEWNAICRAAGEEHSEDACDALKVAVERILAARQRPTRQVDTDRLRLARLALIGTGYFTADEVGDDIAPRITELHSALTRQADGDRAVVEAVEALADEWYGDEEEGVAHVAACQDYGCKDCVVIACATDLRAAIAAASEPTSGHNQGEAT